MREALPFMKHFWQKGIISGFRRGIAVSDH
jgi:hypothetical protein